MKRYAFFDVDETLINEKSMFSILEETSKKFPWVNSILIKRKLQRLRSTGVERGVVNRAFYKEFCGLSKAEIQKIAEAYIRNRLESEQGFIITSVIQVFEEYRQNGFEPVFVSGSALDFIQPLARHLRVQHSLATRLTCDAEGKYTGEIEGEPMIGQEKRRAVLEFILQHEVDPLNCAAFGDHLSDLPFLEITGDPHVVATSDERLVSIARQRGWPVITP